MPEHPKPLPSGEDHTGDGETRALSPSQMQWAPARSPPGLPQTSATSRVHEGHAGWKAKPQKAMTPLGVHL